MKARVLFALCAVQLAACTPKFCYRGDSCDIYSGFDSGVEDSARPPDGSGPEASAPDVVDEGAEDASTDTGAVLPPTVVSVSVGGLTTCAVRLEAGRRRTYCWGKNYRGSAASTRPETTLLTPTASDTLNGAVIAESLVLRVGQSHACRTANVSATRTSLQCWGDNSFGQHGQGAGNESHPSPRAVLGDVVTVDSEDPLEDPLATGDNHSCAINTAGAAVCWGDNRGGQCGTSATDMIKLSATTVLIPQMMQVTHVAAAADHSCAAGVDTGGRPRLACWGDPSNGKTGADPLSPPTVAMQHMAIDVSLSGLMLSNDDKITSLTAGTNHTCFIVAKSDNSDSALYCFGGNSEGQLAIDDPNRVAHTPQLVRLIRDTTTYRPLVVDAGSNTTCALGESTGMRGEFAVFCWGSNGGNVVSPTDLASVRTPTVIVGLTKPTALSVGGSTACAIDEGVLKCWGNNASGQLGLGDMSSRSIPTAVVFSL